MRNLGCHCAAGGLEGLLEGGAQALAVRRVDVHVADARAFVDALFDCQVGEDDALGSVGDRRAEEEVVVVGDCQAR